MSEQRRKPRSTDYEGPAELFSAAVSEREVFQTKGMPGAVSVARFLTAKYGPEGKGWGVEATVYADDNELRRQLHSPEFDLATEAMANWLLTGRYELDDGTNARDLQRYAREPDTVDVVIYPDGKLHQDKLI